MARLLTYKDGRLRTGRVAMLLFFLMVTGAALLFEFRQSMDDVLVSVKHVFKPKIQQAKKALPEPVKQIVKRAAKAVADASPAIKEIEPQSDGNIAGGEKDAPNSGGLQSEKPKQNQESGLKEKTPGRRTADADSIKPEDTAPAKSKAVAETQPEVPDSLKEASLKEIPRQPEVQLDVSDQMKRMTAGSESEKKDEEIDLTTGLSRLLQDKKDTKRDDVQIDPKPLKALLKKEVKDQPQKTSIPQGPDHLGANVKERSVTVSSEQYLKLFQDWRTVGSGSENGHKVPLRVENLKSAYSLFQMKPVAVVGKRLHFDLSDGTRIPESSLAEYSTTVFRVDDPWEKWGDGLSEAGIRESDTLEVRYRDRI